MVILSFGKRIYAHSVALLLVSLVAIGGPAWAEKNSKSEETVLLVAAGAEFDYLARSVPLPSTRYIQIALHDFDALSKGGNPASRPLAVEPANTPPAGWPHQPLRAQKLHRGATPIATRRRGKPCACNTEIGDSGKTRLAVLYASHRFSLPPGLEVAEYPLLRLKLLYRDGVRVFLNGKLIALRNLSGDRARSSAASRPRGPEWETFLIPLSSTLLKKENLLSIEVRPTLNRHGVKLDVQLELQKVGRLVRGPMISQVRDTSALIVFDTSLPQNAMVEYGESSALGKRALSAHGSLARHHRVRLRGLRPGQRVFYRVVVAGKGMQMHSFHVSPSAKEPLHFAVYGDMRGGHKVHETIVQSLLAETIDFVIVTGDLVLRGSDEADWQRFFAVARPLLARIPYYPVAGNHDRGKTGDEKRYMNEVFVLWPGPADRPLHGHWHSFDVSGVHFVMLDSNHYRDEKQLAWLGQDLKQARKRGVRAIFAAVHAGPFSRGLHRGNSYAAEHVVPLLRQYGVSVLFSGHDHLYQRGKVKGLAYMVSGGGGAPLYSVRCGKKRQAKCKVADGMQHVAKAYHYILVSVFPGFVRACPKKIDGSPLEACTQYPLPLANKSGS